MASFKQVPKELILDFDATDVPVHGNQDLKRGLLGYLLKQAGLTEEDV